MVMTVAWLNCLLMVSCMRRSVAESTEAVASSSNRIWDRLQHVKKLRGGKNTAKVVIIEHLYRSQLKRPAGSTLQRWTFDRFPKKVYDDF